MLRVSTLYASSAAASAAYYASYLAEAPGEVPGVWCGGQADGLGLTGPVMVEALELLLSGRDPVSGMLLGRELLDRYTADGRLIRAVAGFDATFSAPKSLSVWWALTGDDRLLEAHDAAVAVALGCLERFGSTTRVRANGGRLHLETQGLSMATFRQTTSRADDPQVHTHAVISAKVQTVDGGWLALDARFLKRHQRMLGGLYQSALRSELTARYGVGWESIVNGQAELTAARAELLQVFSKRTGQVDEALEEKLVEFRDRHGRDPTRWERAALTREAAVDTRSHKSGAGARDLRVRWLVEAAEEGWRPRRLTEALADSRTVEPAVSGVTVEQVVDRLSTGGSTWGRADVLRTICDLTPPLPGMSVQRWTAALERACDQVLARCVNLDPDIKGHRRVGDGRSVWTEPVAPQYTSEQILAEEEHIIAWSIDANDTPADPSNSLDGSELDVLQAAAAAAVAGRDRLVLVVGPAGTGKTRTLEAAVADLHAQGRLVFGVAPTAKAARTLERDAQVQSDTVAKLLHECSRPDRPPLDRYRLSAGATVLVDEAGMIGTGSLHRLVVLAEQHRWRLVLVGDPYQLQAVGRGGMFHELCRSGPVHELERIHRFTQEWEAAASLQLRRGDPAALDAYLAHGRIVAGSFEQHAGTIATAWIEANRRGETVAITAATNQHVDALNRIIQAARVDQGDIDPARHVAIAAGDVGCVGDVIATRRNDRQLTTTTGEPVRNRDLWIIIDRHPDGSITVSHHGGHGVVVLPAHYVRDHVRLGYAATEHGTQSDTVTTGINLTSTATGRRGLYVGATRGRERNTIHVITDSNDLDEARDVLEAVLASDRADIPAVTQRQFLAEAITDNPPRPASPRPAPVARCPVPGEFATVYTQTQEQLTVARAAIRDTERCRNELNELEAALARAGAEFEPYRAVLVAAQRTATSARRVLDDARRRHDNALRRHRPQARRDLAAAEKALVAATSNLERLEEAAGGLRDRYHDIRSRHVAAERTVMHLGILERWGNHQARAEQLEQLLDALDTWTQWTRGNDIPTDRLKDSAVILETHARLSRQLDVQELAATVHLWASQAGIESAHLTTIERDLPAGPRRNGLDLGLGR